MSHPYANFLTFDDFANVNLSRARRWHGDLDLPRAEQAWNGADWSNAMCGEAGEAANVVKKLRRHDLGLEGALDPDDSELLAKLADEIGDTVAYLFLLAAHYGINVAEATRSKFNRVSEREGFPEYI